MARDGRITRKTALRAAVLGLGAAVGGAVARRPGPAAAQAPAGSPGEVLAERLGSGAWEVVDLSVTTGEEFPVNFPEDPQFEVVPLSWFRRRRGPSGRGESGDVDAGEAAVNRYEITEHTGTQIDFPPHFVPPPGVDVPGSPGREIGRRTGDRYPLTALMGPAVVLDLRAVLADHRRDGRSAIVRRSWLERWEARFGRIAAGEVPLLFSGYTDRHFRRFPGGDRTRDRLLWAPLVDRSAPGWVALSPAAVELLHDRGVRHVVTDGPSFGAANDAQPAHVAGLKHGMTYTETAIGLGRLPVRGAFYVAAPYKVEDQQAAIARALAFSPSGAAAVRAGAPLRL